MGRDALGGGERDHAVGIGIVAERGGEGDARAGAREIDGGVEGVAAAGQREAAVAAAASSIVASPTHTTGDFGSVMVSAAGVEVAWANMGARKALCNKRMGLVAGEPPVALAGKPLRNVIL